MGLPMISCRPRTFTSLGVNAVWLFLACVVVPNAGFAQDAEDAVPTEAGVSEDPASAAPATETAAPPTENTAPASESVAPTGPQTANEAYDIKVRAIEGKINDLKERIWRAKAKLTLLTEQVTGGLGSGASAVIVHQNTMGSAFLLTEAHYFLDGAAIWQDSDETGNRLTGERERLLFDGNLVEGSHTLTVNLVYRGNGTGVFSYLDGYTFRLQNSVNFTAEAGKVVTIRAIGYEDGDFFTTQMTDRPAIKFRQNIDQDQRAKLRSQK